MKRAYEPSSYKDPSGSLFWMDGEPYRVVNKCYSSNYDYAVESGLYEDLFRRRLLIPHTEMPESMLEGEREYKILKPQKLPFISYPYEWCFSMLKDAALTTLEVMDRALRHGMILKDASAYNIQFVDGRPIFIDTLSFERYQPGKPWVAYGQFCRHFLAPLALMAYTDARLSELLISNIDGIPLDLACRLLPWRTRLRYGLFLHLFMHAAAIGRADKTTRSRPGTFSRTAMSALVDSLLSITSSLSWSAPHTAWSNYYSATNYSIEAMSSKKKLFIEFLGRCKGDVVLDVGSNDGLFSRIAEQLGKYVISCDNDPAVVEKNYIGQKKEGGKFLPLVVDILNPSPSIGWQNQERIAFLERLDGRVVFVALAVLHHFVFSGNITLRMFVNMLSRYSAEAIVEFVPKTDTQVLEMIQRRDDVFQDYSLENFIKVAKESFFVHEQSIIHECERVLLHFSGFPDE